MKPSLPNTFLPPGILIQIVVTTIISLSLLKDNVYVNAIKSFHQHRQTQSDLEVEECIANTESYDLVPYTNPFWFVDELFIEENIYNICAWRIDFDDDDAFAPPVTLNYFCEWSDNDAPRSKGMVYQFVEDACAETDGMMYLAYEITTTNSYVASDDDILNFVVTETYTHRNVPLCLAPGCDAEIVLDKIGTLNCTQWNDIPSEYEVDWPYTNEDNSCRHDFNVASTYMDEDCETKRTYNDLGHECYDGEEKDGATRICDYSSYTESGGGDFREDYCDDLGDGLDADLYKYSFKNIGLYNEQFRETRYKLNNPTCLKRGCDVPKYYLENLLPYHSINLIGQGSRLSEIPDFEAIIDETTGFGIAPVSAEADLCFAYNSKSSKKKKGSKSDRKKSSKYGASKKSYGPSKNTQKPKKKKMKKAKNTTS